MPLFKNHCKYDYKKNKLFQEAGQAYIFVIIVFKSHPSIILATLPTSPPSSRTFIPLLWNAELVSRSLTMPLVNLPDR